jgi:hypothetical protein
MATYDECAAKLRKDGFNHVDSNRWAKIVGKKIIFAKMVSTVDGFEIEKKDS